MESLLQVEVRSLMFSGTFRIGRKCMFFRANGFTEEFVSRLFLDGQRLAIWTDKAHYTVPLSAVIDAKTAGAAA